MKQRNALLSVYNKDGIEDFAKSLTNLGFKIYSSGGTAKAISAAGVNVTDVADLVGGKAILDHRVVTLSRELHAGFLAQFNDKDEAEMKELGIPYMHLVHYDLYPLSNEVNKKDASYKSVTEQTDIGGPAGLNAAAKGGRIVVSDLKDRSQVINWLKDGEKNSEEFLRQLAAKAHFVTSRYYLPAANFKSDGKYQGLIGEMVGPTKYGENAWQKPAALYSSSTDDNLAVDKFEDIGGDARSFVNLTDVDSLLQIMTHIAAGFETNFGKVPLMAVGVKHGNACGAAVGDDAAEVIRNMVAGDKRAIFGGVVMTNFSITAAVAKALLEREENDPPRLFDGIFAPEFSEDAPDTLQRYRGKCRMMANSALNKLSIGSLDTSPRIRPIRGGFLMQPNYTHILDLSKSDSYGEKMSESQLKDMALAWAVGATSNSNTITITKDGMLLGNGVGQQDRVGAAELAIKRATDAGHDVNNATAWSDSFFPAPDGPTVLGEAGISAIFSSSGSRRDPEIIAECKKQNVSLLMQPDSEVRGFAKH